MAGTETQGNIVTLDNVNVGELTGFAYGQGYELVASEDALGRPRLITSRGLVPWAYAARLSPSRPSHGHARLFCSIGNGLFKFVESTGNSIVTSPVSGFSFGTNWTQERGQTRDEESLGRSTLFYTDGNVLWDNLPYDGNLGESEMRSYGTLLWNKATDLLSQAKNKCAYANLYDFSPTRPGGTMKTSLSGYSDLSMKIWPQTSGGSSGKKKYCHIDVILNETRPASLFYVPMLKRKVRFNVSFASNENRTYDWMDAAYRTAFQNILRAFSCRVYVDLYAVYDVGYTENTFSQNMRLQLARTFDCGTASALLSEGQSFGKNLSLEYTYIHSRVHLFILSPRIEITPPTSSVYLANVTYNLGDLGSGVEVLRPAGYAGGSGYLDPFAARVSYNFKATYVGPM